MARRNTGDSSIIYFILRSDICPVALQDFSINIRHINISLFFVGVIEYSFISVKLNELNTFFVFFRQGRFLAILLAFCTLWGDTFPHKGNAFLQGFFLTLKEK